MADRALGSPLFDMDPALEPSAGVDELLDRARKLSRLTVLALHGLCANVERDCFNFDDVAVVDDVAWTADYYLAVARRKLAPAAEPPRGVIPLRRPATTEGGA